MAGRLEAYRFEIYPRVDRPYHLRMTDIDQSLSTNTYAALQRLTVVSASLCDAVKGAPSAEHDLDAQPFIVENGEIRIPIARAMLLTRQRPISWRAGNPIPSALEWNFYLPDDEDPSHLKRIGHLYVVPSGPTSFDIRKGTAPADAHQLTTPLHPDFLMDLRAWIACRLHEIGHFLPSST